MPDAWLSLRPIVLSLEVPRWLCTQGKLFGEHHLTFKTRAHCTFAHLALSFFDSYFKAPHQMVPRELRSEMHATANFTKSWWEQPAELRGKPSHTPHATMVGLSGSFWEPSLPPTTTMVGLSGSFWGPLGAAPPLRAAPLGHAPLMGFVLAPCPMTGAFKPLQWPLGSLTRGTVGLLLPQHRQHHRGMANHWGERRLSAAMPTWVTLGPALPRCKQGPSTMVHTGAHRLEPQKALRIP